jgi:hypothetical protein
MRNNKEFLCLESISRRVTICVAVALMMLIGTYAETPDGEPPSVESVCEGLQGSAFGLCNSYCEALDCDSDNPKASQNACERVLVNFDEASGGAVMPCLVEPQPELGLYDCPCNFDVEFWTDQAQILQTGNATACEPGTMDPPAGSATNACFTCNVAMWSFNSTTSLSVVVDLWVDGEVSTEDALFFTATDPSAAGACFAEGSVDFEPIYTTIDPLTQEVGELPLTSEEFSVCLSDITAVRDTFLALCQQ